MTVEEFFLWQEGQPELYELVEGHPLRLMAGASRRHDQIVVNIIAELRDQLRGGPCRPFTSDTSVATSADKRRRPDAGVECGELRDDDLTAQSPRLVVEVLSPSTREFDMFGKLDEYKLVDSLDYILLVEPNAPQAILWRRGPDRAWEHQAYEGLDREIGLAELGVALRLDDLYAGLTFKPRPQLVREGPREEGSG
jgi:Uma2 family endonuclease